MNRKMVVSYCIALLFVSGLYAGIEEGLVSHWPLSDGQGNIAMDIVGGNHGTLKGNTTWTDGKVGGALLMDGEGDYVDCGNDSSFNITDSITLAAWVQVDPDFDFEVDNRDWSGIIMRGGPNVDTYALYYWGRGTDIGFKTTGTTDKWSWQSVDEPGLFDGQWHHVAAVYDGSAKKIYMDGQELISTEATGAIETSDGRVLLGAGRDTDPPTLYHPGKLDDARIYARGLSQEDIGALMDYVDPNPCEAANPNPAHKAEEVQLPVLLIWQPGECDVHQYNVYFSMSFDDVENADMLNPLGVLVAQGLYVNSLDPGPLEYGQTYFWRVDVVNPDNSIIKGSIWDFTVEPFSYSLQPIAAAASSVQSQEYGPEKTIDGSGLNDMGQHSTEDNTMWLSGVEIDTAPWIQYEFDKTYKLHDMWVWNYNGVVESTVGLGAKDVTIEISLDGTDWTTLEDVPQFNQAPGQADYTANTVVDFGGALARYVKMTITSGYGAMPYYGLSEVSFQYIPLRARNPHPADGETSENAEVILGWHSGREAVSHEIFLGTSAEDLALIGETNTPSFNASELLNYATTYYWSVTEVNEAGTMPAYPGDVWSFSTPPYCIVDDFEQYNDFCNRIFFSWQDGVGHGGGADIPGCDVPPYEGNGGGAIVGYDQPPYAERTIVNAGSGQSMPLSYNNSLGLSYATRSINNQDWTAHGIQVLSLAVRGTAGNTGTLYVKINDTKVVFNADIAKEQWMPWLIDLTALSGLQSVTSLTVGVDGINAAGMLYIDDIRLYSHPIEFIIPAQPDAGALLIQYAFDEGSGQQVIDSSGRGNHGTIVGNPQWVTGMEGSALFFDGQDDYVGTEKGLLNDLGQFTIACWVKADVSSANRAGLVGQNDCIEYGFVRANTLEIWIENISFYLDYTWPYDESWYHIAAVGDGKSLTIYVNGRAMAFGNHEVTNSYGSSTYLLNIAGGGVFDDIGNAFQGQLDDVCVYNTALSPEELAVLAGYTEPMPIPFQ